ncbi:FAD-binding domain-containing protein [Cristinia sonorae]|uniref:FAD-binding domain-containing protein n=1 Tax=Cristinia sonorae TaxID=1940300 RepID=A0A8K0XNG7_9AGAR|nr:FAD-binding domain-containing protein [Cristinia sonorae]
MRRSFATVVLLSSFLTSTYAEPLPANAGREVLVSRDTETNDTCVEIAKAVSRASAVFWPVDLTGNYVQDNFHWASSSSQLSACSVEPGNAQDVSIILKILGKNKTPFAVKGGGHASNPGFSSTKGVQISMSRFDKVVYNAGKNTVDVGPGLIWDDVYEALEPFGVNVVGGRVTGVGVAGFTLGGGYSWLTNQRGLTVDNIESFEVVLPSGQITTVSDASNPDLFFALRGGFNNFGIVTKFTLKTYPQGKVWGGTLTILGNFTEEVNAAVVKYSKDVTDPKAVILPTYNFVPALGTVAISVLMFYDGPTQPAGYFDDFLAIPALSKDVSSRSFLSLVKSSPSDATLGARGIFNTVAVETYDDAFLKAVTNETFFWGRKLSLAGASLISYDIEPFLPSILSHGSNSAYPPIRSKAYLPTNLYFAWIPELSDDTMHDAIRQSTATLTAIAKAQGQKIDNAPLYGNYAMFGTPVSKIYGANEQRLRDIKRKVDPENVMGLAGGWKL